MPGQYDRRVGAPGGRWYGDVRNSGGDPGGLRHGLRRNFDLGLDWLLAGIAATPR